MFFFRIFVLFFICFLGGWVNFQIWVKCPFVVFPQSLASSIRATFSYMKLANLFWSWCYYILVPTLFQALFGSLFSDALFSCRVEATEDGDYEFCFDNSFSQMSHKMVFFVVTINSQSSVGGDEGGWADVAETEALADYRLEDVRVSRGGGELTACIHSYVSLSSVSEALHCLSSCPVYVCLFTLSGKDGLCAPEPGEQPPGSGCPAGLWDEGPLPPGGQPVAGVLLVLCQPSCHVGRCRHSNLHTAAPVWRQKAGPHVAPTKFSPLSGDGAEHECVYTRNLGKKIPRLAPYSFCTENFVHSIWNVGAPLNVVNPQTHNRIWGWQCEMHTHKSNICTWSSSAFQK